MNPTTPAPAGPTVSCDATIDPARRAAVEQALARLTPELGLARAVWSATEIPGGAANANFRVTTGDQRFVLRIADPNGARFGMDRGCGFAAHRAAADLLIAPPLRAAVAPDGHCLTDLVDGRSASAADLADDALLAEVGRLLARLHSSPVRIGRWSVIDATLSYVDIARSEGLTVADDTPLLIEALERTRGVFAGLPAGEVLCHNDLVPQNLIIGPEGVTLVDWEYGGMAYGDFDLGNLAMNADLSDGQVDHLMRSYLGRPATDAELARVRLMALVAALREYFWAVVADPVLNYDIEHHGVDYLGWGHRHLLKARAVVDSPELDRLLRAAAAS